MKIALLDVLHEAGDVVAQTLTHFTSARVHLTDACARTHLLGHSGEILAQIFCSRDVADVGHCLVGSRGPHPTEQFLVDLALARGLRSLLAGLARRFEYFVGYHLLEGRGHGTVGLGVRAGLVGCVVLRGDARAGGDTCVLCGSLVTHFRLTLLDFLVGGNHLGVDNLLASVLNVALAHVEVLLKVRIRGIGIAGVLDASVREDGLAGLSDLVASAAVGVVLVCATVHLIHLKLSEVNTHQKNRN